MCHLLWAALLLLYCTCGCFGALVMQELPQKGQSAWQAYTVSTNQEVPDPKNSSEWQPIRIGVYTKYVEDAVRYCKGEDMTYDEIDEENGVEIDEEFEELCEADKITEEKKNILFNDVLPKAIKLHTDRLKVKPVKETPRISSNADILEEECNVFSAPLKRKVWDNAVVDFMIYVSLSTTYESVSICSQDNEKRPTSAVIKFVPKEIIATRMYIRLTAHEIAHALGLQFNRMKALGMIDTHRGKVVKKANTRSVIPFYVVKSSKTVEKVQEHFGCKEDGEVKGLYLENGNGRTPSHWERRIAKDELMSTYIGEPTGMYYSVLTLAVFHDMPYYSAVFEMAEPMSWGNKSGCEFLKGGEKGSADTKYPKMFCKEDKKETLQCTSDRFALGMCFTKNNHKKLPGDYQYFKDDYGRPVNDLMDDYPIIKPLKGTACEGGNESLMPGSLLGPDSRCLNVNALELKDKRDDVAVHGICAKVKCEGGKVHVQYKGEGDSVWHECKEDDYEIKVQGSVLTGGSIVCPKYEEVCTGLSKTDPPTMEHDDGAKYDEPKDEEHMKHKDEQVIEKETQQGTEHTKTDDTPASPPPTKDNDNDDDVEKEVNVPTVNDKSESQTDTKPESTVDTLPQVPPKTSEEVKKEDDDDDDDNETAVTPSDDESRTTTTKEDSVNQSADTATVPSEEPHDDVSDNSNKSEIPPQNMDLSQKDDSSKPGNLPETEDSKHPEKIPQDEDSRKAEIQPEEGSSSKPESSDKNDTGGLENEQGDHNTGKDTADSELENMKSSTGVISWKDSDHSVAISFFGPLMLLVCAVAAVVAL